MRQNARMSRRALVYAAAIGLIAAALYAPARGFGLVWDDPLVIDKQLPQLNSLRLAFFPPVGVPELAPVYYRPLVVASYLIDQRWLDPAQPARTFHTTTVLWHALACLALFGFARRLALALNYPQQRATGIAAAIALLFATAPIHIDAVAAITGRADVMAAAFVFAAAWSYLAALPSNRTSALLLATGCLVAALLCKEVGVAAVPLLIWLDVAFASGPALALRQRRWGVLAVGLASYVTLRLVALVPLAQSTSTSAATASESQPWTVLPAFGWYMRKLLWPLPQSPFVPSAGGVAMGLFGAVCAAGLIRLLWRAWRRGEHAPEATGVLLLLAALVPALCVPLLRVTYLPVAERYLYLPSAGALVALVMLGAQRLPKSWGAGLVASAALLGSWQTFAHQSVWRDAMSLWTAARDFAPAHHIPYAMLGRELAAAQRFDEAESLYRRGLEVSPDGATRAALRNNLGSLQRRRGGDGADLAALETFRAAIADDPRHWPALYNFSITQLSLARTEPPVQQATRLNEAIEALARAESIVPDNLDVRLLLARTLAAAGRRDDALRAVQRLIELAPSSPQAREARTLR